MDSWLYVSLWNHLSMEQCWRQVKCVYHHIVTGVGTQSTVTLSLYWVWWNPFMCEICRDLTKLVVWCTKLVVWWTKLVVWCTPGIKAFFSNTAKPVKLRLTEQSQKCWVCRFPTTTSWRVMVPKRWYTPPQPSLHDKPQTLNPKP